MRAHRIAEYFGDALGEVLDNSPDRMREVPGVGGAAARLIAAAWRDASGLRELTVFLRGHGLAATHARRIHKFYGKDALEVVKRDPYVLARTIHGIGFRTADAIAEKLGIPRNSIQRARAAVLYILERMSDEGHVYSPFEYLEGQFRTALDMEPDLAHDAVNELAASGEVIAEAADDHIAIYLARLHEAEVNVAARIAELSAGRAMNKDLIDRAVAAAIKSSALELSAEQKSALRCSSGEPRHRHHRRSRHRQDDLAAFAAGRARRRRSEADAGRTDRPRRAPAPGRGGPRRKDDSSPARIRSAERRLHPRQEFPAPHQLSDHRRSLDDGRRARLEPAVSADAELLAALGRRSRSTAVGRPRQRAQGRDRVGLRAGGAVEGGLSAGAPDA